MTLARKLGVAALGLVIVLMLSLAWLLATESGARFVLGKVQPYLPAELELGELRGSLIDSIGFDSVKWSSETFEVAVRDLSVEVELTPLLSRHVAVQSLDAGEIAVISRPSGDGDGQLPTVDLPLEISIDSSSLRLISVTLDDDMHEVDEIRLSGSIDGSQLDVASLVIRSDWINADLDGQLRLAGNYPGRIGLDWKWRSSPSLQLAGQLELQGDIGRYDVDHRLRMPQQISTAGHVSYVDDALEFDLSSDWTALEWPFDESLLTSNEGTLRMAGNLDNIGVALDARAALDDLPEALISLEAVLDTEEARVTRLEAASDLGSLAASGDIRWQPTLDFDTAYSVEGLDPALASELLNGQVNADGVASGEWIDDAFNASVVIDALDGQVNDQALGGGATVAYAGGQFTISGGRVELGSNEVGFSGVVGEALSLDWQAELREIRELLPGAAGSLSASISLRGSLDQPNGRVVMNGSSLSWSDYAVEILTVDAAASPTQELALAVEMERAAVGNNEFEAVKLGVSGKLDEHTLQAEVRTGGRYISAETVGAYAEERWTALVRSLLLDSTETGAWSLRDPAELEVARDTASISRACLDRSVGSGQACIEASFVSDQPSTFDVTVDDLPIRALSLGLPTGLEPSGYIDLRAAGSVAQNRLTGEGSMSLQDARIDAVVNDETITAAFTRADASISVVDNRSMASLQLELADGAGSTALDVTIIDVMDSGSGLAGRGTVNIDDLSLIAALQPEVTEPRGTISGSLGISGSLAAPEFLGSLALSDGGFEYRRTGIEISDINARLAQLAAGQLQLEGSARSGDGEIAIRGNTRIDADTGLRAELQLTGENFELSRLPDWQVAASPAITVVLDENATTVSGDLSIPTTSVRLRSIPETAETASRDAVVHRAEGATAAARRRIDVDVAVGLGEDVRFDGFGLTTGIEGTLRVQGGTHAPYTGLGRLSLTDGRYKAYGQELEIERGQLIFNGPLDNPQLDVRAVRRLTDVTAGIDLSGTPTQLESNLFSDPPMGDVETLSYLLTGRPLGGTTSEGGDTLNAAAFALGLSSAGNIVSQVKTGLSLDTLAVEGGAEDGRLIAGKRFGRRLFVEYGYGLVDELGTLLLRYELSNRVVLESRTGEVSSYDILYRVRKQ